MPIAAEKPNASRMAVGERTIGHCCFQARKRDAPIPNPIPIAPPAIERVRASIRNWQHVEIAGADREAQADLARALDDDTA